MRLHKYLRRLSESSTHHSLVLRDTLVIAAARIEDLENELKQHRHSHDSTCEYSEEYDEMNFWECSCGASTLNQRIDELLASGEMNVHKRDGDSNENIPEEKMTR
jgi:hypothetical protein